MATQPQPVQFARGPIAPGERAAGVDILRGFCIFGILVENMLFFGGPFEQWQLSDPWWPGQLDQIVNTGIRWLEEGKFYSLFSLLYGFGVSLQMQRAKDIGGGFARLHVQRSLALLAIGLAHGLLLWWGDVLCAFAVLGLLLLPFRRVSDRALIAWASALWLGPLILVLMLVGANKLAELSQPPQAATQPVAIEADNSAKLETARVSVERYGSDDWSAIWTQRWADLRRAWAGTAGNSTNIFMMFLVGMLAGRRGYLIHPEQHLRLLANLLRWAFPIGLLLHLGYATTLHANALAWRIINNVCYTFGFPLLTFGYAAAVILLATRNRWRTILSPLAAVGRMSLSNYLLQTVLCTTLFYGYGFGLYGKIGPAVGLIPTVLIYAGQVVFSNWWLARFRFGPAEWLWRSVTYGKPQPLLR